MLKFLSYAIVLALVFPAFASPTFRVLKQLQVPGGSAYLTVSERPHVLGQPYHLELRVHCSKSPVKIENLEVKDSLSVCDMDPKSIKLNTRRTAIAMKTKLADVNKYYDQLGSGETPANVPCQVQSQVKKFSLNKLCSP